MPDKHYLRSTGNAVAEHAISEHWSLNEIAVSG
jgi:hypothetical protein